MKRRVVVTGMGIVSSIGANLDEVSDSLRHARSGVSKAEEHEQYKFRSLVHAYPKVREEDVPDDKVTRFMADGAMWNYIALKEAIKDAKLEEEFVSNPRTGLVMGSGGPPTGVLETVIDTARARGARRVPVTSVAKSMTSTTSANLSVEFKILGPSYSISSACATSAHCIGNGYDFIRSGVQDVMLVGGGEPMHWSTSIMFDAMGALSSKHNDTPETASRPFDKTRDGFVISGGGGALVLEELEFAKKRGARIHAELVGYGATSDGKDMVQPSGEGAVRCIKQALEGVEHKLEYINAHATSTPVGDMRETQALREVFGDDIPAVNATKALSGHSLGAAGAHEAIYTLLMMRDGFLCESAHIQELDEEFADIPVVRECREVQINCALSNSFGFGGTNASLTFARFQD
ncbi:MAG: beta-ketoacyl synthase N-terminal-like domain-containing protein [Hyphomicrobiales bacterium]|nr:beta-ketoacyl synthase N-terminal-like domain-containing protein [Hyphomicrobiales bacterium]MCY4052984.1 beta-ketoacyl synthase N-terminal-like domain-containing protein [Hyphomicrobiales bacterium]